MLISNGSTPYKGRPFHRPADGVSSKDHVCDAAGRLDDFAVLAVVGLELPLNNNGSLGKKILGQEDSRNFPALKFSCLCCRAVPMVLRHRTLHRPAGSITQDNQIGETARCLDRLTVEPVIRG